MLPADGVCNILNISYPLFVDPSDLWNFVWFNNLFVINFFTTTVIMFIASATIPIGIFPVSLNCCSSVSVRSPKIPARIISSGVNIPCFKRFIISSSNSDLHMSSIINFFSSSVNFFDFT